MSDKLFDCLNVRSIDQATRKGKPELLPYTDVDDPRFAWMMEFIGWLDGWKGRIEANTSVQNERNKMFIAPQTYNGLKITILSSIELTQHLLCKENAPSVYTSCFNQDALESYFSMVRDYGGSKRNPTVKTATEAADVIRNLKVCKPGQGANTIAAYLVE